MFRSNWFDYFIEGFVFWQISVWFFSIRLSFVQESFSYESRAQTPGNLIWKKKGSFSFWHISFDKNFGWMRKFSRGEKIEVNIVTWEVKHYQFSNPISNSNVHFHAIHRLNMKMVIHIINYHDCIGCSLVLISFMEFVCVTNVTRTV